MWNWYTSHGLNSCDPRLSIYCILHCKYSFLTLIMGICCSTFVQVNAGTSGRDLLTPEGIARHLSVSNSNLLTCRWAMGRWECFVFQEFSGFCDFANHCLRSMLLALLALCARGSVLIENPDNSMINLHKQFRWLARRTQRLGFPVPWWDSELLSLVGILCHVYSEPLWWTNTMFGIVAYSSTNQCSLGCFLSPLFWKPIGSGQLRCTKRLSGWSTTTAKLQSEPDCGVGHGESVFSTKDLYVRKLWRAPSKLQRATQIPKEYAGGREQLLWRGPSFCPAIQFERFWEMLLSNVM